MPSAMSSAIARLEHELETPLFDRTGSCPVLTEQGAALQAAALRVVDAVQAARDEVAAACGQVRGTVTLGCTMHTGRLDLAAVLSGIRDRHPGVVIQLRQSHAGSAGMMHAVRGGVLDIALTAIHEPVPGIVLHPLFSEPMVFICQPGHRLSRRTRVTVRDLREELILRPPPGWGTRAVIDAALGATRSAFEVASYSLMARMVHAGFAATLAPASAINGDMLDGLCAVPVDDSRLRWSLHAAVCAERRMTGAATALLQALIRGAGGRVQEPASPGLVQAAAAGKEPGKIAAGSPVRRGPGPGVGQLPAAGPAAAARVAG